MRDLLRSATLKLTGWYLLVLMFISIGFSTVLYQVSSIELDRALPPREGFEQSVIMDMNRFRTIRREHIAAAKVRLVQNLTIINLMTLALGGAACYFLARRTLRPIEQAIEAQSRFTSDASHELRTPLAAMQMEIEIALRDAKLPPKKLRQLLSSNLEEVNKLRALSDRLLRLATKRDIPLTSVDLATAASEAVSRVQSAAQAKNITITTAIEQLGVRGDSDSLTDLLVILLENAVKYSPADSNIELAGRPRGKTIHLSVRDHGVGIAPADLPHIFERFFRADTSRASRSTKGYGLGLSIAQQIVELHHGQVEVTSKLGAGTTFTIKLPADSAHSQKNLLL